MKESVRVLHLNNIMETKAVCHLHDPDFAQSLKERFDSKWTPEPNSGCWLWIAGRHTKGYGGFGIGGRKDHVTVLAHRVAWTIYRGSIPDGMSVLHHCDTPACVNPEHLFLGNDQDNCRDMIKKGRSHAKLTREQANQIRMAPGTHRSIAAKFGVSYGHVWKIKSGRVWNQTEDLLNDSLRTKAVCEDHVRSSTHVKGRILSLAQRLRNGIDRNHLKAKSVEARPSNETDDTLSGDVVAQQSASSPPVEGAGVPFDSVVPAVSVAASPSQNSLSFTESAADLAHVEAFSQWLDERGDALPDEAFSQRLERTEDSLMQ